MPLDMFKNMIGSNPKASIENKSADASNLHKLAIRNGTSNNKRSKSLSQINGLHSHRNMKISHQILLAESMHDPTIEVSLQSCFEFPFPQSLSKNEYLLPNFIQFIETEGTKDNKKLIRCFLQANCLMSSLKENFSHIDLDSLTEDTFIDVDENKLIFYKQFMEDFQRLYKSIQCEDLNVEVSDNIMEKLICLFETDIDFKTIDTIDKLPLKLFNTFWQSLAYQIESIFVDGFKKSNYFLKYELDVLKNGTLSLSDILFSNTFIQSTFLDFAHTEGIKDYFDFLLMYNHFKMYSCQYSDALAIFERFFNSISSSHLNFSEDILFELAMSMNGNHFSKYCYDKIASILIQYFSKTYLPQFLQSEQFIFYIENIEKQCSSERRKADKSNNEMIKQLSTETSNISLAEKSTSNEPGQGKGQLQFTFIDKFGRMNSLVENRSPSPSGKLSQVMKKFSFNPENDNEKEDNAWKIAESIVNDVCSITNPLAKTP